MNTHENEKLKSEIQFQEAIASFEKALKDTKALLEKAESLAKDIGIAVESSNLYVSDSEVEDDFHRSSTHSIFHGAIAVEEKSSIGDRNVNKGPEDLLKIYLPKFFEEK